MYSIANAEPATAFQNYCWYGAHRAVLDAISELEAAGVALLSLSGDTTWHADAMRALNAAIDEMGARAGTEANALRTRLWELEAVRV